MAQASVSNWLKALPCITHGDMGAQLMSALSPAVPVTEINVTWAHILLITRFAAAGRARQRAVLRHPEPLLLSFQGLHLGGWFAIKDTHGNRCSHRLPIITTARRGHRNPKSKI